MVCSFFRALCALGAITLLSNPLGAQQKTAYELLPENTQGVVWIRSGEELLERWDRTQLSELLADKAVAPFFEGQRKEIEQKFLDAGWRLSVKPEDLADYVVGQMGFAWTAKDDNPLKPFTLALIADVENDVAINARMISAIEKQLNPAKTKKATQSHNGVTITKYTMPPPAGQLIPQDSYIAIHEGLFLSSDDESGIHYLIDRAKGSDTTGTLAQEADFQRGRQLAKISGDGQLEYFVRPLGFARVIRAIGGKRSKNNSDMLAILENQGFDSIRCFCGELKMGGEELDIEHRGYVYAKRPLPKSAGILDFQNAVSREVPDFVGENISTFLSTNWNAKEAFWKTEGLVDELAGTPGVFDEVIEGIMKDPNGPQIDIANDVLPLLTNEIFSMSDSKQGDAAVDSSRNLIALRVKDSDKMARILNRAMKGEPDAELVEFEGHDIWQVVHREDEDILGGDLDFGDDFGAPPAAGNAAAQQQPWLSNWAITVHGDFLMFASHAELIEEAILQSKTGNPSPLLEQEDYRRIVAAIADYHGEEDAAAWQMVRTSKAVRVRYELFRKGELRKSQSMLASILDRLVQQDSEIRNKEKDQKIKGEGLPPFEAISKYLQPSGLMVRTTENGWEFGSLLLSEKFVAPPAAKRSAQIGTARASEKSPEEVLK